MRKKYFTYLVAIQTISILGALSSILEAYCMGEVVDNVGGRLTEEFILVLIIGINMLCQIAANISGNYLMNRYTNEKRADISRAAAHKLLNVRFCDVPPFITRKDFKTYTSSFSKSIKQELESLN